MDLAEQKVENIPLHVYFFEDGENHWILALNEQQARHFFENNYSDCSSSDDYDFREVVGEELDIKQISNSEEGNKEDYVSIRQIVEQSKNTLIPRVLASSVY